MGIPSKFYPQNNSKTNYTRRRDIFLNLNDFTSYDCSYNIIIYLD